jgi:FdhE protein
VIEQALARLDQLARTDVTLATLARLQAEVLRASADGAWGDGVPELDRRQAERGVPLLHGLTLRADAERVRHLLGRLAKLVSGQAAAGVDGAVSIGRAVETAGFDVAALVQAVIVQDGDTLARLAAETGADPALLATLGQLAALPLLQACGRRADSMLAEVRWQAGYCPVCVGWPTLAELRGLERTRWLRCGRCGSGWSFPRLQCPYCANVDHRQSGYLAPESQRESRRATTCDACQGYLKTVTTIGPIAPVEIGLMDAQTLELDVAAIEEGYGRPDAAGFPLTVAVELTERRSRWRSWRR